MLGRTRQPLSQPCRVPGWYLLALACVCLGSAPAFAQQTNLDYYKAAGTEHLRNVEQYHVGPAMEKLRVRRYQAAIGDIQFVLRHFPNHPQALMLMIDVLRAMEVASMQSHRSHSKTPSRSIRMSPRTYVLQGIYLYRAKRFPAAIASFEKALTIDPDSVNAHYNLGLAYFETKQFELANVHAQRAYQLGASAPGLRDKLIRAGQWKPIDTPMPDAATSIRPGTQPSPTSR